MYSKTNNENNKQGLTIWHGIIQNVNSTISYISTLLISILPWDSDEIIVAQVSGGGDTWRRIPTIRNHSHNSSQTKLLAKAEFIVARVTVVRSLEDESPQSRHSLGDFSHFSLLSCFTSFAPRASCHKGLILLPLGPLATKASFSWGNNICSPMLT
jgi:hypothetical protein